MYNTSGRVLHDQILHDEFKKHGCIVCIHKKHLPNYQICTKLDILISDCTDKKIIIIIKIITRMEDKPDQSSDYSTFRKQI